MSLIFDLDLTLIDSTIAEAERKARRWGQVYSLIPKFKAYEGIADVLTRLNEHQIAYGIVTTSPSPYCDKVCAYWHIAPAFAVCYHDVPYGQQKPHPAPILKALRHLKVLPAEALSLGDRDIDIIASNVAGVPSVACLWGTSDKKSLLAAKPTFLIEHPKDILTLVKGQFGVDID